MRNYENFASTNDSLLIKKFPFIKSEDLKKFEAVFIDEQVYGLTEKNVGFDGRLWLLVDENVWSAAEGFTIFCKSTGFATVIGERTGGGGKSEVPIAFPLPNSGLLVLFEDVLGFNDDGTCNAFVGTTPDIEVADPDDALEVCLDVIEGMHGQ